MSAVGTGNASERAGDDTPRLVIAILNWNGYALTRQCVESLDVLEGPPHTILVVDNGSDEPEAERLADEFPDRVTALSLGRNLGVGAGYNAAIRWARDNRSSHVLLLNNDTVVRDPELARRLVDACGEGVLAVGPLIIASDTTIASAGGKIDWETSLTGHHTGDDMPTRSAAYPVTWVDGSCMLLSISAACAVNGFSEEFFLYWEEVDLCVRAWRKGFSCLVEPRASIVHLGSQTVQHSRMHHLMLRNAIFFMRRNASRRQQAAFFVRIWTWLIPRFLGQRTLGGASVSESLRFVFGAVAWNLRDAWAGRSWRRQSDGSLDC